ncbi:MAG: immunity 53 family protein [Chthoniobacterales bacterium]
MNELPELQNWYAAHCDGEREHQYGITIESLDNPGWWIKIDLHGTELEHVPFSTLSEGDQNELDPKGPWLRCTVREGRFEGAGDPGRLQQILRVFLDWAHSHAASNSTDS